MERTINNNIQITKEQALDLYSSDAFISVNKKLLMVYGPEITLFISNLIDQYKYLKNNELITGDWFYFTADNQSETLGMSKFKIRNCKQQLIDDGILSIKFVGVPPKEFYKINVVSLINKASHQTYRNLNVKRKEIRTLNVKKLEGYNNTNKFTLSLNKNKEKNNKKTKTKKVDHLDKCFPLAERLHDIISNAYQIHMTKNSLSSWANEIRLLHESNKISFDRIENAIEWYSKHIKQEFIPVIQCGKSFRDKFVKLENAMERGNQSSRNKNNRVSFNSLEQEHKFRDDGFI